MRGFTIDSFNSLDHGIRLTAPVALPASVRVVEDVTVVGCEGSLTRKLGWADNTIILELLIQPARRYHVEETYQRLAVACLEAKRLELSGQPKRYRQVKHASLTPLVRDGSWGRAILSVVCAPFAYHTANPTTVLTNGVSSTVRNPGLLPSRPLLTVQATGTASFTINGHLYTVNNLAGQAVIDSMSMTVSSGNTRQLPTLTGGFPEFAPGSNQVSLGSGVKQLVVIGNWRDP